MKEEVVKKVERAKTIDDVVRAAENNITPQFIEVILCRLDDVELCYKSERRIGIGKFLPRLSVVDNLKCIS